ncbi:MAG: hypothetical protein ACF8QF_14790 [Phycisphaerales bacterium]
MLSAKSVRGAVYAAALVAVAQSNAAAAFTPFEFSYGGTVIVNDIDTVNGDYLEAMLGPFGVAGEITLGYAANKPLNLARASTNLSVGGVAGAKSDDGRVAARAAMTSSHTVIGSAFGGQGSSVQAASADSLMQFDMVVTGPTAGEAVTVELPFAATLSAYQSLPFGETKDIGVSGFSFAFLDFDDNLSGVDYALGLGSGTIQSDLVGVQEYEAVVGEAFQVIVRTRTYGTAVVYTPMGEPGTVPNPAGGSYFQRLASSVWLGDPAEDGSRDGATFFRLPDGYSAYSLDGSIVGNVFVPTAPTVAPFAFLGLLSARRRRSTPS